MECLIEIIRFLIVEDVLSENDVELVWKYVDEVFFLSKN